VRGQVATGVLGDLIDLDTTDHRIEPRAACHVYHMGVKKSSHNGFGSISAFLGSPVRVFYSLLFICALEVLLWSCILVPCQSSGAFTDAAQAYYTRETVNLKSTTGHPVRVPVPPVDVRSLNLAFKAESLAVRKALDFIYASVLNLRQAQPSQSLILALQAFSDHYQSQSGEHSAEGNIILLN